MGAVTEKGGDVWICCFEQAHRCERGTERSSVCSTMRRAQATLKHCAWLWWAVAKRPLHLYITCHPISQPEVLTHYDLFLVNRCMMFVPGPDTQYHRELHNTLHIIDNRVGHCVSATFLGD
jgi:hypothetical protein